MGKFLIKIKGHKNLKAIELLIWYHSKGKSSSIPWSRLINEFNKPHRNLCKIFAFILHIKFCVKMIDQPYAIYQKQFERLFKLSK